MPRKKLLLDTGPLVALFDRGDAAHHGAVEFFTGLDAVVVTTWPVLTEVCHFIPDRHHAALLRQIGDGWFGLIDVFYGVNRMADLMEKYQDIQPGLADVSLIYAAEVTGISDIATLDSEFSVYRINGKKRFSILGF